MHYLNLDLARARSAEVLGSEPLARATWFMLLCYCASQENGGVIICCDGWSDRQWQQVCGVTHAEVRMRCPLWRWQGSSLVVWGYPQAHEDRAKFLRSNQPKATRAAMKKRRQHNGSTPPPPKKTP